jgi:protein-S-isoprenylcysteine O-methyltransferase Ste14
MIAEQSKDTPNVISCPPLVFFGALGVGFLLNWLLPIQTYASESSRIIGGILGLAGTSFGTWGAYTLRRAGTAVRPDQPVTALVTGGPFRYSRNPLYIGLTTIYVGITITCGEWWPLATLVPALALVHWRIVRREEQYLEGRFGDRYRDYKAHVRRWI